MIELPKRANASDIQADGELCDRVTSGDIAAQNEFYERFHRLGGHFGQIASRRCVNGVIGIDDLGQEAYLYMREKAETYDPTVGIPFASYVSTHMLHNLNKTADRQYGVHISSGVRDMIRRVHAINSERFNNRQPILSDEDIARELDIPLGAPNDRYITVGAIRQAMLLSTYLGSTDTGFNPSTDHTPGNDYVLDEMHRLTPVYGEPVLQPDEKILNDSLEDKINEMLYTMVERERNIIILRYGLNGNHQHTYAELSDIFGITVARVKTIESRAMSNLRKRSQTQTVDDYL